MEAECGWFRPYLVRVAELNVDDKRSYNDAYTKVFNYARKEVSPNKGMSALDKYVLEFIRELIEAKKIKLDRSNVFGFVDEWDRLLKIIERIDAVMKPSLNSGRQRFTVLAKAIWFDVLQSDYNLLLEKVINLLCSSYDEEPKVKLIKHLEFIGANYIERFTDQVEKYYRKELTLLQREQFLKQVYNWMQDEKKLIEIMSNRSADLYCQRLVEILIVENKVTLLESLRESFRNQGVEALKQCYQLLKYRDDLMEDFDKIIYEEVTLLFNKQFEANTVDLLPELIKLFKHYLKLLNSFMVVRNTNTGFMGACIRLFNNSKFNVVAALTDYVDQLLRRSGKYKFTEAEAQAKLSDVLDFAKCLHNKDELVMLYTKELCKRLLHTENCSMYLEDFFFQELRCLLGSNSVIKPKAIFDDLKLSEEITGKLITKDINFQFNVIVMSSAVWPLIIQQDNLSLPEPLSKCLDYFTLQYGKHFERKKLSWLHNEARVHVKYGPKHELVCTLFQYAILEKFNKEDTLSKEQLLNTTNLNPQVFQESIAPLTKLKILAISKSGDKYRINGNYSNPQLRISCVNQNRLSKEDKLNVDVELDKIRVQQITACIVRNMKQHKKMEFKQLKLDVMTQIQVRFSATMEQFKRGLDYCLEKEYLEEVERTPQAIIYKYLD